MPLGTLELALIFIIALLLFGPQKLPELARSLGEAVKEFKQAVNNLEEKKELKD